jgi:NAD-dependent deacetylase
MQPLSQQISRAAGLIKQAQKLVAMTGAGISTASGIPDFRSPDSGLWDSTDPLTVASIFAFRQSPAQFYNWIRPMAGKLLDAQPNPAHYALAALENQGKLQAVITQNIDDLHTKAGSKTVYELHGNLRAATCVQCYEVQDSTVVFDKFVHDGEIPRHHCGGVLKPNVVLFGEQLPHAVVQQALAWMRDCDLILVVGSSLEVTPAAAFPLEALNAGARLIIINRDPTYLDVRAACVLRDDVADVLPRLVDEVLRER